MMRPFRMEGISGPAAYLYSSLVTRSPVLRDFYRNTAEEVSARMHSGRMLDLGTGPGNLPLEIAKRSPGLEIIGVDISSAMAEIARRKAEKEGLSERVVFRQGDAASLPFGDGHFDFVLSTLSLHHWARPQEALREVCRVLKAPGEAWVYDLARDASPGAKQELRREYGWLQSSIILNVARLHSSVSLNHIQDILSDPESAFSEKRMEERGVLLKLTLVKGSSISAS